MQSENILMRNILRISGLPEKFFNDHAVFRLCHDILVNPVNVTDIDCSHGVGQKPEKLYPMRQVMQAPLRLHPLKTILGQ